MTLAPVQVALLQTFHFTWSTLVAAVVQLRLLRTPGVHHRVGPDRLVSHLPLKQLSAGPLRRGRPGGGPDNAPIRSVLPPLNLGGMALDLSPIVAIFALSIARRLLLLIIAGFVAPVAG